LFRTAFTLIELLVVMIIMVSIVGLVMPKGSKMLSSFEKSLDKTKEIQKLSKERSYAFFGAKNVDINLSSGNYHIPNKGVISKDETSYDND